MKFEQALHFAVMGKWYGIPPCCTAYFIRRVNALDLGLKRQKDFPASKMDGTGYVPCPECERKYSKRQLKARIRLRRLCPIPFPHAHRPTTETIEYARAEKERVRASFDPNSSVYPSGAQPSHPSLRSSGAAVQAYLSFLRARGGRAPQHSDHVSA